MQAPGYPSPGILKMFPTVWTFQHSFCPLLQPASVRPADNTSLHYLLCRRRHLSAPLLFLLKLFTTVQSFPHSLRPLLQPASVKSAETDVKVNSEGRTVVDAPYTHVDTGRKRNLLQSVSAVTAPSDKPVMQAAGARAVLKVCRTCPRASVQSSDGPANAVLVVSMT